MAPDKTITIEVDYIPPKFNFNLDDFFWSDLANRVGFIADSQIGSNSVRGYVLSWDDQDPYNPTVLSKLLLEAYWASFQHEEGVHHNFSICFVNEDDKTNNITESYYLKEPVIYERSKIAKLAPSVGDIDAGFIVSRRDSTLYIIGITTTQLQGSLIIKAIDPGCVICGYMDDMLAVIEKGTAYIIRNQHLARLPLIWQKFQFHPDRDNRRIDFVLDTLRRIRRLERGGALFFVPSLEHVVPSIDSNIYAPTKSIKFMPELFGRLDEKKEDKEDYDDPTIMALRDMSRCIARFTSVDGATFMNMQLEVLSFGVKLKSPTEDNFEILTIDPLFHDKSFSQVSIERFGGKRHQSAARFIYDNHDAIAFVVSQDGEITCLIWNEAAQHNGVYAYKRLELTII